jgi:zinc protease
MESMIPMVTVAVEFRAGSVHEPADRAGLARIAADTISPAPPSNPEEGDPFARVGIAWGSSSDEDSTRFTARGMEIYLDVEIKGLERLIKAGEYDQRQIEEEQRLARVAARRKSASAREHFYLAFNQAMFPSHPYGRMETVQSLSKVGRDQAMAWRSDHYTAKNGTIVITGKFDPGKAETFVRETFGQWSSGKGNAAPAATSLNRGGPTFIAVDGEALPTVEVIIGYPMPAGVDASYAARLVLAEMMTERVASVREKLGASYGVYARQSFRLGPGELTISGPVDAARAGEALKAMRDGVDAMRHGDHVVEDFVRARRDVLRKLVADSTDSGRLAARLLVTSRHGLPPSFDEELIQKVAALTPREIMAVLADVRPEAEVVALLGAKKFVEKAYQDAGITGVTWK